MPRNTLRPTRSVLDETMPFPRPGMFAPYPCRLDSVGSMGFCRPKGIFAAGIRSLVCRRERRGRTFADLFTSYIQTNGKEEKDE